MISMDTKGITWVGNVYQKFEAMCLEVEEIMYQDTVKYVENQVQTVGASVKRFYSDVMQDLLPPSSLDSEKVSPCGLILEQDSDDICKKPNLIKKEEPAKADKEQLNKTLKKTYDTGKDSNLAPVILVRPDGDDSCRPSGDCVKGACSDLHSRQYHEESMYSSNFGVNENQSQDKLILTEVSCAISPEKYLTTAPASASASYCESVNQIHVASWDQTAAPTTSFIKEDDSMVESSDEIENTSEFIADSLSDCQSSNEIILIKSIENNGKEMGVPSWGDLSAELNEMCLNNVVSSKGDFSQKEEVRNKHADEEVFTYYPRKVFDWNIDATESETVTEHGTETIQQSDKMKLEETCVVVNDDELRSFPQQEAKWRPYKKKIREALYSRMRSARKQEYKQLMLQYENDKKLNQEHGEASTPKLSLEETKKSSNHGSCESEWELL